MGPQKTKGALPTKGWTDKEPLGPRNKGQVSAPRLDFGIVLTLIHVGVLLSLGRLCGFSRGDARRTNFGGSASFQVVVCGLVVQESHLPSTRTRIKSKSKPAIQTTNWKEAEPMLPPKPFKPTAATRVFFFLRVPVFAVGMPGVQEAALPNPVKIIVER